MREQRALVENIIAESRIAVTVVFQAESLAQQTANLLILPARCVLISASAFAVQRVEPTAEPALPVPISGWLVLLMAALLAVMGVVVFGSRRTV